jgi:hypothetical protein
MPICSAPMAFTEASNRSLHREEGGWVRGRHHVWSHYVARRLSPDQKQREMKTGDVMTQVLHSWQPCIVLHQWIDHIWGRLAGS